MFGVGLCQVEQFHVGRIPLQFVDKQVLVIFQVAGVECQSQFSVCLCRFFGNSPRLAYLIEILWVPEDVDLKEGRLSRTGGEVHVLRVHKL